MSFSMDVKNEICKIKNKNHCCKVAQLYGMILFAQQISKEKLKISTENVIFINSLNNLSNDLTGENFDISETNIGYIASMKGNRLTKLYDELGIGFNNISLTINLATVENECCIYSFLRGVFLSGGYICEPMAEYRLEIVTPLYNLSKSLCSFLRDLNFNVKTVVRKSNYIIYIKECDMIERFLHLIGAKNAAFELVDTKIYKEVQNYKNRLSNCEVHNIDKMMTTAVKQVNAIEKVIKSGKIDILDEELKYFAKLRMENKESSLSELVSISKINVSKASLSRKLNKIIEISEGL